MPLLKKRRLLAAGIETTAGTAESLSDADSYFNVYDLMIQPNITVERREGQGAYAEDLSAVAGQRAGTATFRTDMWYDGTSTEPLWADVFLPACGWVKTTNTFNNRLEAPGSAVKTVTIECYMDGVYKRLYGAMGNFRIVLPTGRMGYIEWTFQGVFDTPSDAVLDLLTPVYPTDAPMRFASGTVSWNSVDMCVEQVEINSGNTLVAKECQDNEAGIDYFLITDRQITITANPEATLVATNPIYTQFMNNTEAALNIEIQGPAPVASTSTLDFNIDKAQIQNVQEADRNGIVIDQITWQANKNGTANGESLEMVFAPSA